MHERPGPTATGSQTPIYQLGYSSRATLPFSDADLVKLLDVARKNNFKLSVTGMLLYHEGAFLQVLEGDATAVKGLYDKITRDSRHDQASILFEGRVAQRSFPVWTMGFHRPADSRDMPAGLNKFLEHGVSGLRPGDGDKLREILKTFRDGQWRQTVDA